MNLPDITHGFVEAAGVRVFYRETGPETGIPVLLLHGFPSGSHQFRRLMEALGARHRLIAPDYPGFGHTEAPEDFDYTFERLTDVIEAFVAAKRLDKFVLFLFDFGGPVDLRLALRHPDSRTSAAHPDRLGAGRSVFHRGGRAGLLAGPAGSGTVPVRDGALRA